jgi:hypothetical protein
MSLSPIMFFPGGRRVRRPILDVNGRDIRPPLERACEAAHVSLTLALACAMAESDLDPRTDRFGRRTAQARAAIANGDHATLGEIIQATWPDVSFGFGQRIVKFHYVGNLLPTVANVLAVREHVFAHPDQDLLEMARTLARRRTMAANGDLSLVGGDLDLGTLVAYNAGHFPLANEAYWTTHAGNVNRYREKLALARAQVG